MGAEMKRMAQKNSETRELSDKELRQITSAMGDSVRLQTLNISSIIQANLKAEFAARRKSAHAITKERKAVAA